MRFPPVVTIELELVDRALKRYPVVSYEEVPSSVAKTNVLFVFLITMSIIS